jgi:hypothetical protein
VTVVRHSLTAAVAWAQSNHGGKCSSQLTFHPKKGFSEKEESPFFVQNQSTLLVPFRRKSAPFLYLFNIFLGANYKYFGKRSFPLLAKNFYRYHL